MNLNIAWDEENKILTIFNEKQNLTITNVKTNYDVANTIFNYLQNTLN